MHFFIPFLYFFNTRVLTYTKLISWFVVYFIPFLLLSFLALGPNGVFFAMVTVIGIYSVYELGYIWNDAETIKFESNPTLRLNRRELIFYEKYKVGIYCARALISIVVVCLFDEFFSDLTLFFIINLLLILFVYVIYNSVRNRLNLLLHIILVTLRCSFIFLYFGFEYFAVSFLLFPLINFFERASQKRFDLPFFQRWILSNKRSGRYVYYLIVTPIVFFILDDYLVLCCVMFLFLFRFLSEVFYRKSTV
ncbi:hypothetical protein BCU85_06150 [Vibrio lentus]|nr:hypothetical protein BCU85_06150 [Vibrio lentus]PMK90290.1 hypothetical protein BCT88_19965 [Vibrio lentus]PML20387.1 hypothetical protein BCT80_18640 [Vibrio lentus]PMM25355.1 hypothetical protein BCT57_22485 [Vibrio lentus]PMM51859.1 hypothetical protein BCT53_00780 [Vibrio lentus]